MQALHASGWQGALYVTGGGSGLVPQLLTIPGASATVLEATVPYSESALESLIGKVGASVNSRISGALGMKGFARARELAGDAPSARLFGFGLTAALATNRKRRGEDRAHMSVQTLDATHKLTIRLVKGVHRQAQEKTVSDIALAFLQQTLLDLEPVLPGDAMIETRSAKANPELVDLTFGERAKFCAGGQGALPEALFCGAFDPFHQGHQAMLDYASHRLGCAVALELCIANADKAALDYVEVERRIEALSGKGDLWLTRLPLFSQKAEAFAGVTFVVGVDTMARIADARFYESSARRTESFKLLAERSVRFLVFGRHMQSGFQTLADLSLPKSLRALAEGVSQSEFRQDISSTSLRTDNEASA